MKRTVRSGSSFAVQPARYSIRWLIVSLLAILSIAFFPYLFEGKIFLPADMFDTMTAPLNAQYGPPQAQNFYVLDGIVQTYPWKIAAQDGLRSGHLAYWNPHILGGYPQYAESDGFDVFNVFGIWLDAWHAILAETLVEFLIAGIGMCFLLRFFGVRVWANLIFSSAYMLNSMFVASAMSRWAVASFCWMPFVVLMLIRHLSVGRKEDMLYASIYLALSYLAGTLQSAFFVTCVVACLMLLYPSGEKSLRWSGRVVRLAVVFGLAFSLSAPMWSPTVQLFAQTLWRGSLNSTSVFAHYGVLQRVLSFPLLLLLSFPALLGSPEVFNLKKLAGADVTDFNGAIAFVPMVFAVWGCFALRKRKEVLPFCLMAAAAIILPILTPLYAILYHRVFIVATLCFSVVGAVMFQAFLDRNVDRESVVRISKRIMVASGIFAGAIALLCGYTTLEHPALAGKLTGMLATSNSAFGRENSAWLLARVGKTLDYFSFTSIELWLPIVFALIAAIAIYRYAMGRLERAGLLTIVTTSTLVTLLLFVRMWLPSVDPAKFPIYPPSAVTTFLHEHASEGRFIVWPDPQKDAYTLRPNSSDVYHTNDFDGYESLMPGTMSVLYHHHILPDSINLRLLGLANVKYVVTRSRVITDSAVRRVLAADGLTIYENLRVKPRAYFASSVKILDSDAAVSQTMLQSDFDGSTALIRRPDAWNKFADRYDTSGTMQVRDVSNEEIAIDANTNAKSFLVMTDTYYPGWKCYVNGLRRPIYRVNFAMRGVEVPAGKSVIVFRFEPDLFTASLGLSGLAAVSTLFGIIFFIVKYNPKNQSAQSASSA
ncbi:MAG: YfhO family protein [Bacteroidota bacterium]|nr:YfhO family protein [Bacteroidota bacterium]MDP4234522.1 YfhO family protein [Bacteroidota bacterium]MDP4242587.1 YfhO family protein [Bacteroidota bacterium]MDP4289391.1 YfhO family protein [Bacteroidota bacterium]